MLKKLAFALSTAAIMACTGIAHAESVESPVGSFDISMNAGLTSDYIFRGISQTQGAGAIQGGLDVNHESGFYVGTWASSVDFGAASTATSEFDYYAGFGNDLSDDLSYDFGWIKYAYPGASALNFSEYYGSFTAYGATLGAAYSDNFAGDNSTLYSYVGYEYGLPYDITLAAQYGKYDFKDVTFASGKESYRDWSIGLSKTLASLDFSLTYTDTSLSDTDCAGFAGKKDYCDANVSLSVSKSL